MEWLPVLEVRLKSDLIDFFFGLTEYYCSAVSSSVHVYKISDDRISMIIGTIQGQMLHGLGGTYLRVLD